MAQNDQKAPPKNGLKCPKTAKKWLEMAKNTQKGQNVQKWSKNSKKQQQQAANSIKIATKQHQNSIETSKKIAAR